MGAYGLTRKAAADIDGIYTYTIEQHGLALARKIRERPAQAASSISQSIRCSAVRPGYGDSLTDGVRKEGKIPVFGSNGREGTHDSANTKAPCIVIGRKGSFGI